MEEILRVKDLCKTYIVDSEPNNVLMNVNFSMKQGEFVAIMGPSGSGKSTLLYTVSGMDSMTAGNVVFHGKELNGLNKKELSDIRLKEMGFIFQQMYMLKNLSVLDNIILPGFQAKCEERNIIRQRAESMMRELGIIEYANRNISAVSGGQLQRACLCRAMINNPAMVFADEPTGALNSKAAGEVMKALMKANEAGTSILMVTHSAVVASQCERVIYLMDGGIQGELELGKLGTDGDVRDRERKLSNWLMDMGW